MQRISGKISSARKCLLRMHRLCIDPVGMDVLFSEFKKQGYDSRQKLDFT